MQPPSESPPVEGGAAPSLEPGAVFAERYEILRRLGTGGMGTVYLARHKAMGRHCAIKLLHPSLGRDREARDRFTREARNACRIAHPNVCTVYDFGTTPEGQLFLVLEYVEGRSLGSILAETGTLPLRRSVGVAQAIAAGLDAAHELGLVHRDLKPDNVMVVRVRGQETVKLVDFGIAKAIAPDLKGEVTEAGVIVGTPEYMAPEQCAGDAVDHRSDVYALGLVFCRMVTGSVPFRAGTARESLARRLTERPESLAALAAGKGRRFPPRLQLALDCALSRDPRERFASAGAFAGALAAAVADLPADPEDEIATVRLDAATAALSANVSGWWRAGALLAIGAAGITAAVLLARPSERTASAPPTSQVTPAPPPSSPAGDSAIGTAPVQVTPARNPAAGSRPPESTPALPRPEEVENPTTRDASRQSALQIYARPDVGAALKARAAFIVASANAEDGRFAEAVAWGDSARLMNDRAPAGAERDERRERYERFLAQWRLKLTEPPTL